MSINRLLSVFFTLINRLLFVTFNELGLAQKKAQYEFSKNLDYLLFF